MSENAKLLIATHNAGKLRELSEILGGVPYRLVSLSDVGIETDVEETGLTFEENATLKAETYRDLSGLPTLADDSGLEVDALGGDPGVLSARYAGENATDADRVALLLSNLADVPADERTARFRCVIAIAAPGKRTRLFDGAIEGLIADKPRGDNGFGYDPVFAVSGEGLTMAELSTERKNAISHRAVAARKAAADLRCPVPYPFMGEG